MSDVNVNSEKKGKVFVSSLAGMVGEEIEDFFLFKHVNNRTNSKTNWVSGELEDKTGIVAAVIWSDCLTPQTLGLKDKVVRVRGLVNLYEGKPQIQIKSLSEAQEGEYRREDFVKGLDDNDKAELTQRILSMIESVKEPRLNALLRSVFESDKFMKFYSGLPGGHRHHEYNGGLLVHTLEVAELADKLCVQQNENEHYHVNSTPVDRDICVTGALLHDIGKTREFIPFPFNQRTEDGYYVGYQAEGAGLIDKQIRKIEKANEGIKYGELRTILINIVLSCHTNYRMSMPPRTKEGRFVLIADEASAYRDAYDSCVCDYKQKNPDSDETMIYSEYFKCNIKI